MKEKEIIMPEGSQVWSNEYSNNSIFVTLAEILRERGFNGVDIVLSPKPNHSECFAIVLDEKSRKIFDTIEVTPEMLALEKATFKDKSREPEFNRVRIEQFKDKNLQDRLKALFYENKAKNWKTEYDDELEEVGFPTWIEQQKEKTKELLNESVPNATPNEDEIKELIELIVDSQGIPRKEKNVVEKLTAVNSKSTLRANEVADLDPYNVRGNPVQNSAQELLGDESEIDPVLELNEDLIIANEKKEWEKVLGRQIDIAPLPGYLTFDRRDKLKQANFELLYIPHLEIPNGITGLSPEAYLRALERDYPNWRRYESLSDMEELDPDVSRNLSLMFWNSVKEGSIDIPILPGKWVAFEGIWAPITDKVGIRRLDESWNTVQKAIVRNQKSILEELDLWGYRAYMRLPEALEWNLIENRLKWQSPGPSFWTETSVSGNGAIAIKFYNGKENGDMSFNIKNAEDQFVTWKTLIDFSLET